MRPTRNTKEKDNTGRWSLSVLVIKQEEAGEERSVMVLPKQTDVLEITKHKCVLSTEHSTISLLLVTWNSEVIIFH